MRRFKRECAKAVGHLCLFKRICSILLLAALFGDSFLCGGFSFSSARASSVLIKQSENDEADTTTHNIEVDVGDYIKFGTYPQTAEGNDETPIEWLVLDRDGDNVLLLSRYGLDAQPYNPKKDKRIDITWENCTLRTWLNKDFINRAFTATEQSAIQLTNVDNSSSQGYSIFEWNITGDNTQDKVFLLSYAEANKYLGVTPDNSNDTKSRVVPTTYAIAQGAGTSSSNKTATGEAAGFWWLRSTDVGYALYVNSYGSFNRLDSDRCISVRPALWANCDLISGYKLADKPKADVGDYVEFGTYPQTAAGRDETPIEWLVLERDGDNALLLSIYGLDVQPYNTKKNETTDITWETCTLRTWLNNDFLNRAFTTTEQSAILLTNVDNGIGQCYSGWSTSGGNNTQDKVFLLSYAEANKYLGVTREGWDNLNARVPLTDYAIAQGAETLYRYTGWWWLRSPGIIQSSAADVYTDGSLRYDYVRRERGSVRPALWVNLESGIF